MVAWQVLKRVAYCSQSPQLADTPDMEKVYRLVANEGYVHTLQGLTHHLVLLFRTLLLQDLSSPTRNPPAKEVFWE